MNDELQCGSVPESQPESTRAITTNSNPLASLPLDQHSFLIAIENSPVGLMIRDLKGTIVCVNAAFANLLGYHQDELKGVNTRSITHPDDIEPTERFAHAIMDGFTSQQLEKRYVHRNGSVIWTLLNATLIRGGDGSPRYFLGQLQDIRQAKQAEEALRNALEESELIINSMSSILVRLDSSGNILRWNQEAEASFGLQEHAVLGKQLSNCGVKWIGCDLNADIQQWMTLLTPRRFDHLRYEKEGNIRSLGITVSPVSFARRNDPGLLVIGLDVTKKKADEAQLRQSQKLEAIGRLAAGVAHEINTPTQFVGDNTAFLRDNWIVVAGLLTWQRESMPRAGEESRSFSAWAERFDEKWKQADLDYVLEEIPKAFEQTMEGVERIANIVKAMKDFSHMGGEQKTLVDLNRSIQMALTVSRNEWKYVADVESDLDGSLPLIPCLHGDLNQALLNLIVNAAHAIADANESKGRTKGTIRITTKNLGLEAAIEVEDNGMGIPEDIRPCIFEPFFTTKPVGKGTGQGLAQVHSAIVGKHSGKIWFESKAGYGTTFHIRLPLAHR